MAISITQMNGHEVNGITAYRVGLPYGQSAPKGADLTLTARRGSYPRFASMARREWRFPLRISGTSGAGDSYSTFHANVGDWFSESTNGEVRELFATWHDGTPVKLDVRIESLELIQDAGAIDSVIYMARCVALRPYWETLTTTTKTTSPVVNGGNAPVYPSLALTCSTHGVRKRFTVAGAGRGGGLKQVPIRFDIDSTALTASNGYVYVNGRSVPFYVGDAGLVTSFVWALIDTASDGSATTVDIVYGSGIVNPLAGALDDGGMDWSETGSSNTVWKWDDISVGNRPGRAGVWRPAMVTRRVNTSSSITANTSTGVTISVSDVNDYTDDADAVALETGGVGFTTLANVSREVQTSTPSIGPATVKTRDAGASIQNIAWTETTDSTTTSSISLTNGVQIIISFIGAGGTGEVFTLTLTKASGNPWTLTLADTPTVTLVHTQNLDLYNGTFEVGDYILAFSDFLTEDGTLELAHGDEGWAITSSVSDYRFYGPDDRLTFSDRDVFMRLEAGSNVLVNSLTGASYTLTFRSGFA